jgi:hypothetical protein
MSVNEKLMAPGSFNVFLNLDRTPNSIVNAIDPWGNIVLTPTRVSPDEFTDAQMRDMARYVGIVTTQTIGEEGIEVAGKGILAYLGDSDSRGLAIARNAGVGALRDYVGDTLEDVIDRSSSTPYGILRNEEGNQRAVRKGTVTEVPYDDTVLLLNFEGSDGDTTTTDGSAYTNNQIITFVDTADISTDQAKYGNTSLNLTTDGFITVADRPELDLTYQEFTVEWWEYRTSSSGNPTVMARNDDTYSPFIFGKAVNGRNKALITHDGDGYNEADDLNIDMGSIDTGQWNHFAISHKGEFFRTFKNGVIQETDKRPDLFVRVSSDALQIGKGQGGNYFEGYIDGLVITRGNAKYWTAFTPSTTAPVATTENKTYTGKHYLESAYKALKTISASTDAEFKINNDGTLDVGPPTALFSGHETDTPEGMIVRDMSGADPSITGYSGVDLSTEFDAEDYVSRVELTVNQYGNEINLGQADAKDVPYKDLFGNELERIQILAENDIPTSLRNVRAEAYLNEYNKIQKTLSVGLEDYDISGDIGTGDIIYVWDPDVGFEDTAADAALENRDRHEITYQGQILHPIKIRVMGLSFPIAEGMGVYYRDGDGNYIDLSDYVEFESGVTQIEVGATQKNIREDLRGTAAIVSVGGSNEFTVPDAPTNFSAAVGSYQDGTGSPVAFAQLTWDEPTNTDGTTITDGNMYRVRYRQVTDVDGNGLIDSNDNQITDFEYLTVNWGTNAAIIKGLGVGNTYEFGVTAIDNSGFSGGFAVINAVQMPNDGVAPPEPLPLTGTFGSLAGNAARVTVVHNLGAAKDLDGNTIANPVNFSLPRDIDHLNVYRGTTSNFTISSNNQVGQIIARAGHIDGQIQAMGSFPTTTSGTAYYRVTAVDVAGNESDPSVSAQVTEELIDTQYVENGFITTAKIGTAQVTSANIYDLTASKITAGTITGKEIIIDTDNDDPLNPVLGTIRSDNYVTGTSGWIIKSDGSAEFRNATIRGSLNANDITTGTLDANNVTISNLTVDVADVNNLNFSSLGATSQDIIDTIADNAILNTITNGAISEAKLGNISANKITTGTLDANNVTISNLTVGTGQVTGTFSGNVINGGTINGTTINAGTITTGTLDLDNLSITGTLSAGLLDGDAVLDNLTTSNAIGVQGSGQTSVFVGNIQANRLDLVTNMDADGWTSGDDFRGNGTTVNLYRNFSSKGIRIVGGGSGAYLYTFNSGGGSNLLYNPFSDERLKENITDLSYGLDEINQLRPITYDWKDDVKPFPENTELNYGLLAQELEEVIPALVDTAPDTHTLEDEEGNETVEDLGMMVDGVFVQNTKSYNERPLLYIAIKAIQELSAKNDELESRIATLEG